MIVSIVDTWIDVLVIEDALPADFRAFNMDMASRKQWDWSMEAWCRVTDPMDEDPTADSTFYCHEYVFRTGTRRGHFLD